MAPMTMERDPLGRAKMADGTLSITGSEIRAEVTSQMRPGQPMGLTLRRKGDANTTFPMAVEQWKRGYLGMQAQHLVKCLEAQQQGLPMPASPGMMMMQPGMMQPGMMQPGMMQPGMMQPGMMQPGMMQPGMVAQQPGMPMMPATLPPGAGIQMQQMGAQTQSGGVNVGAVRYSP